MIQHPPDVADVERQMLGQIMATAGFLLLLWRLDWLAPARITRLGGRRPGHYRIGVR